VSLNRRSRGRSESNGGASRRRTVLARAFLALVAIQLAVTGSLLLGRSVHAVARAVAERNRGTQARLSRHYPPEYLAAIEAIRERIGEGDYYLLVDAEPEERGAAYVVNFLLAPRRGILLGRTRLERGELIARRLAQRKLTDVVVWVHELPRPPELLERGAAAARLRGLE